MNRICKAGVAMMLSLCLVSVFLIGTFPQHVAAILDNDNEFTDPIVDEFTTSPSSISSGTPFDLKITFAHLDITENDSEVKDEIKRIEISVSCPNGSIQLRNSKYTLNNSNGNLFGEYYASEQAKNDGESTGFTYTLYIPEKDLKYVGPTSGTLRFTITYYDDAGKISDARFVVQKTVVAVASSAENAILVDEDSPMPSVQAGTTGIVNIPLVSNGVSGDVQITASLPDGVKISFASAGSIYKMHFNDAEKKNLGLNLKIDSSVPEGVYPITLSVGSQTITAYLHILNASGGTGKLVVQGFQLNRSVVNEGQSFTMTVTVKNNSGATYNNVVVALPGLSQEAITANGTMDRKTIPSLESGKTASVTFPLTCNNKMATGNYKLAIQLSADELEAAPEAANVFVPVKGSKSDGETTNTSKPQIIIENYDYGGLSVVGGQEFILKMDFKNTSKSYSIENLKMTVGNPASENDNDVAAFTPSKSSNTFFIENVSPGATFHEEIALYPKADATPKSYGVTIKYTYEAVVDGARLTDLSGEETISIPLTQPDRFEVQDVTVYGPIMLGDQASLQINYVNKGKNTVYNVSLTLEGENFTSGDMNTYIGNVESGSSDYFETTLNAESEGMMTGKAIITYEDANGDSKEIVKEFSCEVMPAYQPPIDEPTGPVEPEAAPGMPVWAVWVVIGVGGVAVILGLVFIKKSIKAKKQRIVDEAENYDDESTGSGEE